MTEEEKFDRAKKLVMELIGEFTAEDSFSSKDVSDIMDILRMANNLLYQFVEEHPGVTVQ